MPTQDTTETVLFTGGVESKLDPVIVDKSKLLLLTNYTFNKQGTLVRRDAWVQALATSNIVEMAALNSELVVIDSSNNLNSFSTAAAALSNIGSPVPFTSIRKDKIAANTNWAAAVAACDSTTGQGLTLFVWTDASNVECRFSIRDETTGTFVASGVKINSGGAPSAPRCVYTGGSVAIVTFVDGATVKSSAVTMTTGAFTAPGTCIADYATPPHSKPVDACRIGTNVAVYYASSGTSDANACTRIVIISGIDGTLQSGPTTVLTTTDLPRANVGYNLAVAAFSSSNLMTAASQTSTNVVNMKTVVVSGATLGAVGSLNANSVTSNPELVALAAAPIAGAMQVFSGDSGATTATFTKLSTFTVNSSGVNSGLADIVGSNSIAVANSGPYIHAKPFIQGGAVFLPVVTVSTLQTQVFVLDTSGNVIAKALYGQEGWHAGFVSGNYGLPTPTLPSASVGWSVPVYEQGRLTFSGGINTTIQGLSRISIAFGRNNAPSSPTLMTPLWHAQVADELFLSGGNPSFYDGSGVFESGFHYFPEKLSVASSGAGTGPTSGQSYQYVGVYEWTDFRGRRHQSAVSTPFTITVDGHAQNVTFPTLQLGKRASNTALVVYRTLGNGTTFFRVSSTTAATLNSLTAQTVVIPDSSADSSISSNEILYTTGGALPNDAPPPHRVIAIDPTSGRPAIAGLENPLEVRFGQAPVAGQGQYWNEALSTFLPAGYGEPQAMAFMDGAWYVWTRSARFVTRGSFPDATGLNGTIGAWERQPTDVGCVDQRTMAITPAGACYQSQHGYYLLNRGGGDSYNEFGASVEGLVRGQVFTSAVVLEDKSQLRLTRSDGTVLCYDYLYGQWSTLSSGNVSPSTACVWQGIWTAADVSNARAIVQDNVLGAVGYSAGTFLDLGTNPIAGTLQTPWYRLKDLQGFQRVKRLGILGAMQGSSATSTLIVQLYFDGTTQSPPGYNFSLNTGTVSSGLSGPFAFRHHMQHQKCSMFSLALVDTPTFAAQGLGANYSGFSMLLGFKKGLKKLPGGQSF